MSDGTIKQGQTVVSGALSLTVSMLAVKILGVIYKIPLAHFLGEVGMGYFNSAYTVYSFFYLLCTAGVPKAIMILISEEKVHKRITEEKIVKCALHTFFWLSGAICAILILFADPLSVLIGNSKSYATMISIAPSILFAALGGVLRGYYNANMNFLEISVSQIIEGVTKLVLGLGFAMISTHLGYSLPIVSALTVLGVTLGTVFAFLYLIVCRKNVKRVDKAGQRLIIDEKKEIVSKIFRISLPITVGAAVMSMSGVLDLALIMRRLSAAGYGESESVALYGNYTTLAIPMFNLATSLITPISVAFLPIFSRTHATKRYDEEGNAIFSSLELSAILAAPLTIGMIVYSRPILALLFGNAEIETGARLLSVLAIAIPLMSVLLTVNSVLEARGGVGITIFSMLLGCVFKMLISYFLLGGGYGILGAPIGTVASYAIALICTLIIAKMRYRLSFPILKAIMPSTVCAFISVLTSIMPYNVISNHFGEKVGVLCAISVCGVLYLCMLRLFGGISIKKLKEMSKYTKFA